MGSTSRPDRSAAGSLDALREAVRAASVPARVASLLLAAETLALLALGVLQVLRGFGSGIDDIGRAETGGVLALVGGIGVALLAAGVLRGQRPYRSPTLVVQILCLPVAWSLLQEGQYGYGIPLLVVPLAIVAALIAAGGFGPADADADAGADAANTSRTGAARPPAPPSSAARRKPSGSKRT